MNATTPPDLYPLEKKKASTPPDLCPETWIGQFHAMLNEESWVEFYKMTVAVMKQDCSVLCKGNVHLWWNFIARGYPFESQSAFCTAWKLAGTSFCKKKLALCRGRQALSFRSEVHRQRQQTGKHRLLWWIGKGWNRFLGSSFFYRKLLLGNRQVRSSQSKNYLLSGVSSLYDSTNCWPHDCNQVFLFYLLGLRSVFKIVWCPNYEWIYLLELEHVWFYPGRFDG